MLVPDKKWSNYVLKFWNTEPSQNDFLKRHVHLVDLQRDLADLWVSELGRQQKLLQVKK